MSKSKAARRVRQRSSHRTLLQNKSTNAMDLSRMGQDRLDAVIVPAARAADSLKHLIEMSAWAGVLLVVLCSHEARVDEVANLVSRTPGAKALIMGVPADHDDSLMPKRTAHETYRRASAGRRSNLSLKRNLGLLLARLHGWRKITFVDDDITLDRFVGFTSLARQLNDHQFAGMVCREFPDNSVVCHARRLAGFPQDNFLTGAVLGVNCADFPVPFFPDIYNEDWFSFAKAAIHRDLPMVGEAEQKEYDPFADPKRARQEEFGDVLAEGLYSLIEDAGLSEDADQVIQKADLHFWTQFIEARFDSIDETTKSLKEIVNRNGQDKTPYKAIESLRVAQEQLLSIDADLCVGFLDAWRGDMEEWARTCAVPAVGRPRDAMDAIDVREWRIARCKNPAIDLPVLRPDR